MKILLAIFLFSVPLLAQDTMYVHVRSGDRIDVPATVKVIVATIDPDTVIVGDSLARKVDLLRNEILTQIPRMETADTHTWLFTEEILTIVEEIKATLRPMYGPAQYRSGQTPAQVQAIQNAGAIITASTRNSSGTFNITYMERLP